MQNVSWTRKIENSSAQQPADDEDGVSERPRTHGRLRLLSMRGH